MNKNIAVLSLLIVLALVNWSIAGKEKHLREGQLVYLQLAPVDPRSLMQGDYMALRFEIADQVYKAVQKAPSSSRWKQKVIADDGLLVAQLDEQRVAHFKRLYHHDPVSNNELLLRYRVRDGAVKFATNAYFFQEGHAQQFQSARYGQFRVDAQGELLLVGMYDDNLQALASPDKR